jgi:hypothetical protein
MHSGALMAARQALGQYLVCARRGRRGPGPENDPDNDTADG